MTTEAIEYVEGLSPEVKARLREPLDSRLVSHNDFNSKKPEFEFLEHEVVIRQANDIFGYDGWGYEIVGGVDLETSGGKQFYRTMVRATVIGAPSRMGAGSWAVASDNPAGHDTAMAGAVTVALKRALRPFGAQFGLGLKVRGRFGSSGRGGGNQRQSDSRRQQGREGRSHTGAPPTTGRPRPSSNSDWDAAPVASGTTGRDVPDLFGDEPEGSSQRPDHTPRIDLPRVKRWVDEHGIEIDVFLRMLGIKQFGTRDMQDYMVKHGLSSAEALIARLDNMVQAQLAGKS